jgi:hypothetical protein
MLERGAEIEIEKSHFWAYAFEFDGLKNHRKMLTGQQ